MNSTQNFDFKNVKLTFINGGPGSGKGTQCDKLVEEFGYIHLSTGDLMREEINKGTPDGERIKKLVAEGQLVPDELTVGLLVKAIIKQNASNYLVDGFPRSLTQALYFERKVTECQVIVNYFATDDTLVKRLTHRGLTSGRADDNEVTIRKRLNVFHTQTNQVLEYYGKLGKVRTINAERDVDSIYLDTKKALLPQLYFVIGPKCSGKTSLSTALAEQANMKYINFPTLCKSDKFKNLKNDDEGLMKEFIKLMQCEPRTRVIIDDFPGNLKQAKFFMRNCIEPIKLINLLCNFDICQKRNLSLGEKHPEFLNLVDLFNQIKEYHQSYANILKFFKEKKLLLEINSEGSLEETTSLSINLIAPEVIMLKEAGTELPDVKEAFLDDMVKKRGFMILDVASLIRAETDRLTKLGSEMVVYISQGKFVPTSLIISMLRNIVYSGGMDNKFLLIGFPESVDQAKLFETQCCKIKRMFVIYEGMETPLILEQKINEFGLESYFNSTKRLSIMNKYNNEMYETFYSEELNYSLIIGPPNCGKSTIAKYISSNFNYTLFDFNVVTENLKKKLSTEENQVETITFEQLIEETGNILNNRKNKKERFIIDGLPFENPDCITKFIQKAGPPKVIYHLGCKIEIVKRLYMAKNEISELSEEQTADVEKLFEFFKSMKDKLLEQIQGRSTLIEIPIQKIGVEELFKGIKKIIEPEIILLINNVKGVDFKISFNNIGINFKEILYVNTSQLLYEEIKSDSQLGKFLKFSQKPVKLGKEMEEINEYPYLSFPSSAALKLICDHIKTIRDRQKYIVIDGIFQGMGNFELSDNKSIDILNDVEKNIGNLIYIIKFLPGSKFEPTDEDIDYIKIEEKKEEAKVSEEKKEGEEGKEGEEEKQEEKKEEDDGKPKFKPEEYAWSNTSGSPRPLGQLFCKMKKCTPVNMKSNDVIEDSNPYKIISKLMLEIQKGFLNGKQAYLQVLFESI